MKNIENEEMQNSGYEAYARNCESRKESIKNKKKQQRRKTGMKTLAIALAAALGAGGVVYAACGTNQSSGYENSWMASGEYTSLTADFDGTTDGTVADVANSAINSLVTISCTSVENMRSIFGGAQQYEVESAGSGVIIGKDDSKLYIATNNHVVEGASTVSVGFVDETAAKATVLGSDSSNDLAVISVDLSELTEDTLSQIKVATIGDSDELVLGDQVVAIGNALGYGQSVTSGYVSAVNRSLTLSDGSTMITSDGLIQTDASINSGNSGGGLFNMKGELIAINEAKASSSTSGVTVDNMGYAIPMNKALPILQSIINGTGGDSITSERSVYMGISLAEVTEDISQVYNMPVGVYVSSVSEGSPASEASLQQGDIITAMDGTSVTSYADVSAFLSDKQPGDEVELTVSRAQNGVYQSFELNITLGIAE